MDEPPKESRPVPTTTVRTRRITLGALIVLLILSGLRLVNSLFQNTDSVIFPFMPRFPWDTLAYSALQLGLLLIVIIVADRELRVQRPARKLVSPQKKCPPPRKHRPRLRRVRRNRRSPNRFTTPSLGRR